MSRRLDGKRISTAVRLPVELHSELQRQADERDVSVNYLVTKAISFYLETLDPPDPLASLATDKEGTLA
jgi:hypothetical protein